MTGQSPTASSERKSDGYGHLDHTRAALPPCGDRPRSPGDRPVRPVRRLWPAGELGSGPLAGLPCAIEHRGAPGPGECAYGGRPVIHTIAEGSATWDMVDHGYELELIDPGELQAFAETAMRDAGWSGDSKPKFVLDIPDTSDFAGWYDPSTA